MSAETFSPTNSNRQNRAKSCSDSDNPSPGNQYRTGQDLYNWSGQGKPSGGQDLYRWNELPNRGDRQPLINTLTNEDWYRWNGSSEQKQTAPLPDCTINQTKEARIATLSDAKASAEDKLHAAEALARQGVTNFSITDKNGQPREVRLELERCGNKELLHMFGADDKGREHVLLRAVCNGDGTYSHEKDRRGDHVSFYGSWWTTNMRNASKIATPAAGEREEYYSARSDNVENRMRQLYKGDAPNDGTDPALYNNQNIDDINVLDQGLMNQMFDRAAANKNSQAGNAVYFKAGMDIDCDGSKRARQIDPCGQSQTSLRYRNGESVDAENINYIVLPAGQYKKLGIKLGDIAAVRYNGKVAFATFADVGPSHKLGEGSMALAQALGINSSPTRGGVKGPRVEYLVFPGSGNGTPGDSATHKLAGTAHLRRLSGMSGEQNNVEA